MARHQIIYTSCMRGIDGVNDGQQIFSYDRGFSNCKSDAVKGLFTYQVPSLEPGQVMTEEVAKEMPQAFSYRYIEESACAVTLNTYLGRDYMGSAGRFGNHLSHSIVCDFDDFDVYPAELYGSTALRSYMEYEEVNNPNPPDYLPTPELEKGYFADIDSVTDFLSEGDNLEYFKKMFVAMCFFKSERKRLVICDEPENIIKWIAALQYTLPLDIAKKVNFTTYEFDPELSPAQICGVITKGTRYNPGSYASSGRHFVFDFLNNQFSGAADIDEPLMDFIDTAMSFSYDSLTEFFDFVMNHTEYRELDERYFSCYLLYSLYLDGLRDVPEERFSQIADFAENFLNEEEMKRFLSLLVDSSDIIGEFGNEYALKVLRYLLGYSNLLTSAQINTVKQMAVGRINYSLSDPDITEEGFSNIYESVNEIARSQRLSIPAELMNDTNRDRLLGIISGNAVAEWKIHSIIRVICDYVKDMRLPVDELYPDRKVGGVFSGIFNAVYSVGRDKGRTLLEKILDNFKDSTTYLTNMALNIEGYLKDLAGGDLSVDFLWKKFAMSIEDFDKSKAEQVVSVFAECERYDLIYLVYEARIRKASSFPEAYEVAREELYGRLRKYPAYASQYASQVHEKYFARFNKALDRMQDSEALPYAKELLRSSIQFRVDSDYVNDLIEALSHYVKIGKISPEDSALIDDMVRYQRDIRKKPLEGRCLLLVTGIKLSKARDARDIAPITAELSELSGGKPAELREDEKTVEKYFDWILSDTLKFRLDSEDYKGIFDLFKMSSSAKKEFIESCCKASFKKTKGNDEDYTEFIKFLKFVLESGDKDDLNTVGKFLNKLNKQKIADLDEEVQGKFKTEPDFLSKWKEVKAVAETSSNFFSGFSGMFKKKDN